MAAAYDTDKKSLLTRLRRIEGQARGVQRMVEEDQYCVDILTQIAGMQSALDQVSVLLIKNHLEHCVTEAVEQGKGQEKIDEMMHVLQRYIKL